MNIFQKIFKKNKKTDTNIENFIIEDFIIDDITRAGFPNLVPGRIYNQDQFNQEVKKEKKEEKERLLIKEILETVSKENIKIELGQVISFSEIPYFYPVISSERWGISQESTITPLNSKISPLLVVFEKEEIINLSCQSYKKEIFFRIYPYQNLQTIKFFYRDDLVHIFFKMIDGPMEYFGLSQKDLDKFLKKEVLTISEVMAMTGLSLEGLSYRRCVKLDPFFIKKGNRVFYDKNSVEEFMKNRVKKENKGDIK